MAEASAVDEPDTPDSTMLATTEACASPARKCPTSARAKSTNCLLMPPAVMIEPARMKYGIASSVKESSCPNIFCAKSGITSSGNIASPMKPINAMQSRIGMPSSIVASSSDSRNVITALSSRAEAHPGPAVEARRQSGG